MAAMSAYGAYTRAQGEADVLLAESKALDNQAQSLEYKESVAWKEANLSEVQAMETRAIGATEERRTLIKGEMITSAQKVSYAASGVRVDSGVVQDVMEETDRFAFGDAMTVRANAEKEEFGYKLLAWKKRGEARTYHADALYARQAARDARAYAHKKRNMSIFDAFASGIGSAAGYRG